jgi:hypothetical protein
MTKVGVHERTLERHAGVVERQESTALGMSRRGVAKDEKP